MAQIPTITADFRDFGIARADTVLYIDCNEFSTDGLSALTFADFRRGFDLSFTVGFTTFNTEQVVVCREGDARAVAGDLTVGYDPGCGHMFAEVVTADGTPARVFAGPVIIKGVLYDVKVRSCSDGELGRVLSELDFIVTPADKSADTLTGGPNHTVLHYDGDALPYFPRRWVIGRGYPGGFPNSLQLRGARVSNLQISGTGQPREAGSNPLFNDRFTADPACTVVGDRIYAYVGEDCAAPGGWFSMPHWVAYSSDDMVNWTCHGVVLRAGDFPNANPHGAWAAQVVERDGRFYFYVTLDDTRDGRHMISVAVGDSPLGPFVPVAEPVVTDDMTPDSHRANADIDPTVLVDDDGSAWIAWGNGDCYMARLDDGMTRIGGPVSHVGLRNYSEGPWLFKRQGIYYMVYAADAPGVQPEQLAYATATALDGEWVYRGLLTGPARYGFTIHPSVNEFNGEWYLFYHDGCYSHDGTPGGDCRRHVCAEPLTFNPDGTIQPITLTHEGILKK